MKEHSWKELCDFSLDELTEYIKNCKEDEMSTSDREKMYDIANELRDPENPWHNALLDALYDAIRGNYDAIRGGV